MSKTITNHSLSSDAHNQSSPSGVTKHAIPLLDDEISNSSGLNFDPSPFDAPNAFGAAVSDYNGRFNSAGSNLVLYSSDANILPPHGAPEILMAAGSSPGSHHGGATSNGSGAALVTSAAGTGLVINVTYDTSVSMAPTGFKDVVAQVVQYFETYFADPITININVGYGEVGGTTFGSGALGESETYLSSFTYLQIANALKADAKGAADNSAVASLPATDPTGGTYWVSTAEGKALGLVGTGSSVDGYVGFSSASGIFDYNNADGVGASQYDFYGVVAHEISEVMGRMLLVGATVGTSSHSYDPLDLFHYSAPGVHDFSGSVPGYFSVDGGTTPLNSFNTVSGGDAGDWAGPTVDAFNAFGAPGTVANISTADLTALDAIGWDAGSSSSPPPPPPPPNPPDLTVSGLSLHDTTLSLQFSNIGQGSAAASTAGLYLSTDGTITTSDTLIATIAIPSLAAGTSVSGSVTVPFPGNLAAGTYHLGVIADYNGHIAESNESNNTAVASIPIILGNSNGNTLNGTAFAEEIIGLGSSDTLIGNGGVDTLIGGSGSDHFRYNATTDGGGPGDTIVDFTPGSDVLDFSHTAFGFSSTGTLSNTNFVANSTGPTTAAQKFWYNTSNFTLYYDADGSGPGSSAHALAQLENHATLNSTNIHLI